VRLVEALTGAPEFWSVPVTLAPSVSEPVDAGVQVQLNVPGVVLDPGTRCGLPGLGAGVGAPQMGAPGLGVTPVTSAGAKPVSVTVRVTASGWPTVTDVGLPATASPAMSAAEAWTETGTGATVTLADVPVFASTAVTLASSVALPEDDGVQVQEKVAVPPPGTGTGVVALAAGLGPVHRPAAPPDVVQGVVTEVTFAVAPPALPMASVTAMGWPTVAAVGAAESAAVGEGAVCTATSTGLLGAVSVAPEFASVPLAVAVTPSVPAEVGVHVQV
jgi:hypothetical protein